MEYQVSFIKKREVELVDCFHCNSKPSFTNAEALELFPAHLRSNFCHIMLGENVLYLRVASAKYDMSVVYFHESMYVGGTLA